MMDRRQILKCLSLPSLFVLSGTVEGIRKPAAMGCTTDNVLRDSYIEYHYCTLKDPDFSWGTGHIKDLSRDDLEKLIALERDSFKHFREIGHKQYGNVATVGGREYKVIKLRFHMWKRMKDVMRVCASCGAELKNRMGNCTGLCNRCNSEYIVMFVHS